MAERFFLTTAIDYVNGNPHLGHAYEKILSDSICRYHRSIGDDVRFLTGVDEHGQKVQQSAQKQNIPPQEFTDTMSGRFRDIYDNLRISYDQFARTTNPAHKAVVRDLLQRTYDKGDIEFRTYEGFYSTRAEQFVTEKEQVDGKWPEIYGEVVPLKEENYFFKLSKYQDWLRDYVTTHEDFIFPAFRRNEVLQALEKPLNDLCISRPKSRLAWGIPLPFNEEYVTYVWYDALVNYFSFAKSENGTNYWPATAHVIGKDIMVPPHAVYWPIMLHAVGEAIPKQLIVHGFWMNRGAKMSKSVGNIVDPVPYIEKFGADAIRYFLLREMVVGQDADFWDEKLQQRYQSDLGNDLGNLVNRSLAMIGRYRDGVVPAYDASAVTAAETDLRSDAVIEEYRAAMDGIQTHIALQAIWKLVSRGNQYVEETAPWKLAKDPAQSARLDVVLAHLAETVRRLSVLIDAMLPITSDKIQTQLGLAAPQKKLSEAAFGATLSGHKVNKPEPLFPRLEEPKK
jgi:methionyl-tRNA synthetase